MAPQLPIAVYYEHPDWFRPLFTELDRRGIPFVRIDGGRHHFDPAERELFGEFALFFNRMSPSAWKRGRAPAIFHTLQFLGHLEGLGVPCFNGYESFIYETSKALQVSLLERLGLPVPRTRVVNDPSVLTGAARELTFPLVVKPNIGGSGAGIIRFDSADDLAKGVEAGAIHPGIDGVLLLQEYHRPHRGSIVRIETLEGAFLYAIRVHMGEDAGFDLCPADICKTVDGSTLESAACPAGAAKSGLTVERYNPPPWAVEAALRIAREARLDVGGIEYLESERDEGIYFYDINALSNFVAEPLRVVGFDPTARLVDALVARARAEVGSSISAKQVGAGSSPPHGDRIALPGIDLAAAGRES
jgi:glutathione synthase/RimK-type ligase-like ATP-grasp enzyme